MEANVEFSEIQQFYKNRTIFITGITSLLGKLVLEKILRTLQVKHVYVLVRNKDGVDAETRCAEALDSLQIVQFIFGDFNHYNQHKMTTFNFLVHRPLSFSLGDEHFQKVIKTIKEIAMNNGYSPNIIVTYHSAFGPLKRVNHEFYKKVSLILGDCEKPDLGMSEYDKNLVINEVECIFHCAAAVKLDTSLGTATRTNVKATRDLLEIAKQIKGLRTFVFTSSVYSNFLEYEIHEKFYDCTMKAEDLIKMADTMSDELLNEAEPKLLTNWPNKVTFTMNVAEDLIRRQGKGLPLCVVRPSLMVSSAEEPVTGYVEKIAGLHGYTAAYALGINRVDYYKNGNLDVVPVDYVVSLMISAGWYTGLQKIRMGRGDVSTSEANIYHCITSQEKPITTDEWMGVTQTECKDVPSVKMIQLPTSFHTACYQNYRVLTFLLHTCMAFLCDTCLKFAGKKPVVMDIYRKLHKDQENFSPYLLHQWYYSNDNTQKLLKRMSFKDREMFNFDVLTLNWQTYLVSYIRGVRVYLLKDPMSTITEGKKKQDRKYIVQLISAAIFTVILYFFGKILFKLIFKLAKSY